VIPSVAVRVTGTNVDDDYSSMVDFTVKSHCGPEPSSASYSFSTWALYKYTASRKVHLFIFVIARSNGDRFLVIFSNIAAKKIFK